MLRRFGFELAGRARYTAPASGGCRARSHLPTSYGIWRIASKKRQTFDIADRAADFDDHHIACLCATSHDRTFDLVGDMRNDLDGSAEIIAAAFLGDDGVINSARRIVIIAWSTSATCSAHNDRDPNPSRRRHRSHRLRHVDRDSSSPGRH